MLSDDEFYAYCQGHGIPAKGIAFLARARKEPPARHVSATRFSGSVRFASMKMHCTIQCESRLEYSHVLQLENDAGVLAYYDQPITVQVSAINRAGKRSGRPYTPDMLVFTTSGPCIHEVKPAQRLEKLLRENPLYISRDDEGNYDIPDVRRYYADFGVNFKVVTDQMIDPIECSNISILQNYGSHLEPISPKSLKTLLASIDADAGATLEELLANGFDLDTLFQAIANGNVLAPLNYRPVTEHSLFRVFRNHKSLSHFNTSIQNLPNEIRQDAELSPNVALLLKAPQKDQDIALERLQIIQTYKETGNWPDTEKRRSTFYSWLKNYEEAEEKLGCGFLGLIPRHHHKGPQGTTLHPDVLAMFFEVKSQYYDTKEQRNALSVYARFKGKLEQTGLPVPCEKTFRKLLKEYKTIKSIAKRDGHKVAHSEAPPQLKLEFDEAKKGLFPLDVVHIDHTEVDVFIRGQMFPFTNARPYITTIIDSYSSVVLAHYLTLGAPSLASVFMVLRRFCKKYEFLMRHAVGDGAAEFDSEAYEKLLAVNHINKVSRRKSSGKDGNKVEKLFDSLNEQLFHQLRGNTKQLQKCRAMDPNLDPRKDVIWTLKALDEEITDFIEDYNHKKHHKGLGCTPHQKFLHGMSLIGQKTLRPMVDYQQIMHMTRPPTRKKTATATRHGVRLEHAYYLNDLVTREKYRGKSFPARWEPDDIGVAYLEIDNQWHQAQSQFYGMLQNVPADDIAYISQEYRYVMRTQSGNEHRLAIDLAARIEQKEAALALNAASASENAPAEPTQRVVMSQHNLAKSLGHQPRQPRPLEIDYD